jgi:hypothetical protein
METNFTGGAAEVKRTFINHVFSTTEEGKAELLNVIQYVILAIVPVVVLNKTIQRWVPDADTEKSSLEITIEILLQLIVIFVGIVLVHRMITYVPTYSGFKYEHLNITNVVLAFLIIVISMQSKIGVKTNILLERLYELWNGPAAPAKAVAAAAGASASDKYDAVAQRMQPFVQHKKDDGPTGADMRGSSNGGGLFSGGSHEPAPANGVLGGSFGAMFT